jgi:hypothetical protein
LAGGGLEGGVWEEFEVFEGEERGEEAATWW